eukprot:m.16450 g.16450  ORF g.16450 m.16450 type:complete len:247 (-) comp10568_c0_seq1:38-778(-)
MSVVLSKDARKLLKQLARGHWLHFAVDQETMTVDACRMDAAAKKSRTLPRKQAAVVVHSGFHILKDVSTVLVHMSSKHTPRDVVKATQDLVVQALEVANVPIHRSCTVTRLSDFVLAHLEAMAPCPKSQPRSELLFPLLGSSAVVVEELNDEDELSDDVVEDLDQDGVPLGAIDEGDDVMDLDQDGGETPPRGPTMTAANVRVRPSGRLGSLSHLLNRFPPRSSTRAKQSSTLPKGVVIPPPGAYC